MIISDHFSLCTGLVQLTPFVRIYLVKIWDIFGKNYGIYWSNTIDNFMGCIRQKLRDVLGKIMGYIGQNYGKYYGIYLSKAMGYIRQKLRGILGKSIGYLSDIIDKIF